MFLAELRRKVPVNDDDLIPANLPRQALRNEFFALLAVGRQPGSGPETDFWEVRQIGADKSASRHVGFAAEVKLRSERMSVI